jgi:hypothetical protein
VEPWLEADGLSGTAGLYTIINGIRVALAARSPLSDRECGDLLQFGFQFLNDHANLVRSLFAGCRLELWLKLADAVCRHLERAHAVRVCIEQPLRAVRSACAQNVLLAIEDLVARQQVVILMLRGCRYTSVVGYTQRSLLLFDSSGRQWISRAACGSGKRNEIYVPSLTAIAVI